MDEDEVKESKGGRAGRDKQRKEGNERHLFCFRDRSQADSRVQREKEEMTTRRRRRQELTKEEEECKMCGKHWRDGSA